MWKQFGQQLKIYNGQSIIGCFQYYGRPKIYCDPVFIYIAVNTDPNMDLEKNVDRTNVESTIQQLFLINVCFERLNSRKC